VQLAPGSGGGWQELRRAPIAAFVVHTALVTLTVVVTVLLTPSRDNLRPDLNGPLDYLVSPLSLWDGGWYDRIARTGYGLKSEKAAFWPLYPMVLRVGHDLTHLDYRVIGVLTSNAAFLAALILLHRLVKLDFGPHIASHTVWLLALSPVAFFFSAVYTESLFLFLSVAAIYFGRTGRWSGSALALGLACLTRSTGVLILIPLAAILINQYGWSPRGWWRPGLQLAAGAATSLAFFWHLNHIWSDPLITFRAQEHWERYGSMPWDTLTTAGRATLRGYIRGRHACESFGGEDLRACRDALGLAPDSLSDDLGLAATLLGLVLLPYVFWRQGAGYGLYALATVVIPLTNPAAISLLASTPRYLLVIFPFAIAASMLLKRRSLFIAVAGLSAAAQCLLLALFAQAYFIG
jgi:hypothetical protein